MTYVRMSLATMVAAFLISGCGLISDDVADIDLTLPDKNFSIDAASWQVDPDQADALLETSCAGVPQVCNTAAQQACAMDCSGSCSSATQTCELSLEVGLHRQINLLSEKPALQSFTDQSVIDVTIDDVTYEVTANTLNVATPDLSVYVAPMSVMDPSDPQAVKIGTVAGVGAGVTTTSPQPVVFTADGKSKLLAMMKSYKTPFNLIVGATLVVDRNSQVPVGKLDAVLHIRAHAGL